MKDCFQSDSEYESEFEYLLKTSISKIQADSGWIEYFLFNVEVMAVEKNININYLQKKKYFNLRLADRNDYRNASIFSSKKFYIYQKYHVLLTFLAIM